MIGEALTVYRRPPLLRKAYFLTLALAIGNLLIHGGGPYGYAINGLIFVHATWHLCRRP